jgi:tetratricopeptide (TPR) repeat protein
MDMRYRSGQGLWYRIDLGSKETWVAGSLVRPRFSIPAVHFLAGLYRYYANRYEDAAWEFLQFTRSPGVREDHLNLATAFQLLGACRLVGARDGSRAYEAYENFSQAVKLTPYDPEAYLLRSITALGMTRPVEGIKDLDSALRLDPRYPPSRTLAAAVGRIAAERDNVSLQVLTGLPRYSRELIPILDRYAIRADTENR